MDKMELHSEWPRFSMDFQQTVRCVIAFSHPPAIWWYQGSKIPFHFKHLEFKSSRCANFMLFIFVSLPLLTCSLVPYTYQQVEGNTASIPCESLSCGMPWAPSLENSPFNCSDTSPFKKSTQNTVTGKPLLMKASNELNMGNMLALRLRISLPTLTLPPTPVHEAPSPRYLIRTDSLAVSMF